MQRLTVLFATREDLVPSVRTADDYKVSTVQLTDLSDSATTRDEVERADLVLFREGDQFKLLKSNRVEAKGLLSFKQAVTIMDIHQAYIFEKTKPAPVVTHMRYAAAKQKEEIIRLLNSPVITRQEKTKMLLNINRFDEARAAQAIEKLKKVIEDREEGLAENSIRP